MYARSSWTLGSLLLVLAAGIPNADAGSCVNYPDYFHWVGGVSFQGRSLAPFPSPGLVIASDFYQDVYVIDVDPPGNANVLATVPTPASAHTLDVIGNTVLCVEDHSYRLLDVSNPFAPTEEYGFLPGFPAYRGGTLDPRTDLFGGNGTEPVIAYLGASTGYGTDLLVRDISAPSAPVTVRTVPMPFEDFESTFYMEQDVGGTPRSFLLTAGNKINLFDVTDPANAGKVGTYSLGTKDVVGTDGWAFAAAGATLRVFDVSVPSAPDPVALLSVPGTIRSLALDGATLYASCGQSGVHVVDVSDPSAPVLLRTVYTVGTTYGATAVGSTLYAIDNPRGLHVFDLEPADGVPAIALADTPGEAQKLFLKGDHLYVADGSAGLRVFDVQDPSAPDAVGALAPPGVGTGQEFVDLKVVGATAYVAGGESGFHVIDVTDPTAPAYLATAPLSWARAVDVEGDHAFVTYSGPGGAGLTVYDVTGGTPAFVGNVSLPVNLTSYARWIDDVVYVGSWNDGLWTVDVSVPSAPVQVGNLPGNYTDVIPAGGSWAFAAAVHFEYEVQLLDLTDPLNPVIAASIPAGNNPVSFDRNGDLLYVACGRIGVFVLDVADPLLPATLGNAQLPLVSGTIVPGGAADVAARSDVVFVARGTDGIAVLPAQCAAGVGAPEDAAGRGPAGITAAPNPFRDGVELTMPGRAGAGATFEVFDLAGRRLRVLAAAPGASGPSRVRWDGNDRSGSPVAPGIYFVRATGGEGTHVARVVRIR